MRHKRNATIATIIGIVALVIAVPIDDFLIAAVIGHYLLGFDIWISLLFGAIIGTIIFAVLEARDYIDVI